MNLFELYEINRQIDFPFVNIVCTKIDLFLISKSTCDAQFDYVSKGIKYHKRKLKDFV